MTSDFPNCDALRLEFANQNAHQHAVVTGAAQFFQLGQRLFAGLGGANERSLVMFT